MMYINKIKYTCNKYIGKEESKIIILLFPCLIFF